MRITVLVALSAVAIFWGIAAGRLPPNTTSMIALAVAMFSSGVCVGIDICTAIVRRRMGQS